MFKKSTLRFEDIKEYKGIQTYKEINYLKKKHYLIKDIFIDGEAPKQYIKAYFYEKGKINRKNWKKYICKVGHKHYPIESKTEYIINQIGEKLGFNINSTRLAVCNNQLRFLAKDFKKSNEKLIHGVEILCEYLEDEGLVNDILKNRKDSKELFTIDFVLTAISKVYSKDPKSILIPFVKMLIFDAIVGNNDRHFYNWALIGNEIKEEVIHLPKFAPIYDSARGLYWNDDENKIVKYLDNSQSLKSYIRKSSPRISCDDKNSTNHFDLIKYLVNLDRDYLNVLIFYTTKSKEELLYKELEPILNYLVSPNRSKLILKTLKLRFKELKEISDVKLY